MTTIRTRRTQSRQAPKPVRVEVATLAKLIEQEISKKLLELLERKHLYQTVAIDLTAVNNLIHTATESDIKIPPPAAGLLMHLTSRVALQKALREYVEDLLDRDWQFESTGAEPHRAHIKKQGNFPVTLPTLKIHCNKCDSILPPHNPGYPGQSEPISIVLEEWKQSVQLVLLPYHCQSCKLEPLVFVVKRTGLKLQLVGRSQFESFDVPKFIPKEEREHYSDAMIAFQAGRVLAGLFFLRTMIEQYMRRVLNAKGRMTGDELGDAYAKLLDDEFPKRFISLKGIYSQVSEKLHAADADVNQFTASREDIVRHFELLKTLPLKSIVAENQSPVALSPLLSQSASQIQDVSTPDTSSKRL